jgi:hypothetical protein
VSHICTISGVVVLPVRVSIRTVKLVSREETSFQTSASNRLGGIQDKLFIAAWSLLSKPSVFHWTKTLDAS